MSNVEIKIQPSHDIKIQIPLYGYRREGRSEFSLSREVNKLLGRAGHWETKSKQAAAKGDYDRAGRLRTKAMQLLTKAQRLKESRLDIEE